MGILLLVGSWILLGIGTLFLWFLRNKKVTHLIGTVTVFLSSLFIFGGSLWVLIQGSPDEYYLPWNIPFGSIYLRIDFLSALFLLLLAVIGGLVALYSYGYFFEERTQRSLSRYWIFYFGLFGGISLVFTAYNGVFFLLAWEGMSITSFFLVLHEFTNKEVRKAGWIYLMATHGGTAFLLVLFGILGSDLEVWDFNMFQYPAMLATPIFLLACIGFGTKAGFMPFHVWLPEAHPAAPSPVSALMSGVMIKTGIYGLIRVISWLEGDIPLSWGILCIGLSSVTGVLGVLHALGKKDLKEILAYSSIENMGIIGMGLGIGLYGLSRSLGIGALLGFTAALFHVLHHGLLKSSLFLASGTVLHATHTRNIEELGGLWKKVPKTGTLFGLSSFGIAGLPPMSGFVGEFLLFLAVLSLSIQGKTIVDILIALIVLISLAVIGVGSVACFTRLFGVVFLGEPRKEKTVHLVEGWTWTIPLYLLGGMNLVLGIGSIGLAPLVFGAVVSTVPGIAYQTALDTVTILQQTLFPLGVLGLLFLSLTILFSRIWNWILKNRSVETSPTWDCGYTRPTSRMQYTASSFTYPILRVFRRVLHPAESFQWEGNLFPRAASYTTTLHDLILRILYRPLVRTITRIARRIHALQEGKNQVYILYIALTLILLMVIFLGEVP
ncbi:MAG: proton-conducting transporter membrane subunit [Spirochaetes bacterium]|nr:proton-conducting transporter membrane subunit [Spirochaetota bacterium]